MLHELPQQISSKHAPGPEVSPEAAEVHAQGQAPHYPALQAPPRDQHGAGRQGEGDHHRAPG